MNVVDRMKRFDMVILFCRCHSTYPQVADREERFTETSIIAVPKISAVPFFVRTKTMIGGCHGPRKIKRKTVTLQSVFL